MVLKDPNAPSKTRSAYLIFSAAKRAQTAQNNPNASMVEISQMLGKMWAETGAEARAPYEQESRKSKATFEKEMEAYKQTDEYKLFSKRKLFII
eukprot:UN23248